jgi:hypothetical protein
MPESSVTLFSVIFLPYFNLAIEDTELNQMEPQEAVREIFLVPAAPTCGYNPFRACRPGIPGGEKRHSLSVNESPESICLLRGSNHP